jgi:hypothetical protein
MSKLLTRDDFREGVFKRDNHKCVFCGEPAKDAHHILERRLWPDGGYYLDNGASVCEKHHLECEMTLITVEQVREAVGILKPIIPDQLYDDHIYDKWGNAILANGQRTKGELFHDESVQKILKQGGVMSLFTDYVKYPRTYHLPWSPGIHNDDRVIRSLDRFIGQRVIVMEKLDGENSTLYTRYFHARSVDSKNHPSRNYAKSIHSKFAHDIPEGWRICSENMYAKHSIHYKNLKGYLYGFAIWNERNMCLPWDETQEWFDLFGLPTPDIIYDGVWDEAKIKALWTEKDWEMKEGYVVRIADGYHYGDFRNVVAKFVRKGHIQTTQHWMLGQDIVPNELENG